MSMTDRKCYNDLLALLKSKTFGWNDELRDGDGALESLLEKGTILNREGKRIPGKGGRSEEKRSKELAKAIKAGKPIYIYRKGEEYPREVTYNKETGKFTVSKPINEIEMKEVKKPHWFKRIYLNLFSLMFRGKSLESVRNWKHYQHEKEAFENAKAPHRVERRKKNDPILKAGEHAAPLTADYAQKTAGNGKDGPNIELQEFKSATPEVKTETPVNKTEVPAEKAVTSPETAKAPEAQPKQTELSRLEELMQRVEALTKQVAELQTALQEQQKKPEVQEQKDINAAVQQSLEEQKQQEKPEVQEQKDINTAVQQSLEEQKQQEKLEAQEQKDINTAVQQSLEEQKQQEKLEAQEQKDINTAVQQSLEEQKQQEKLEAQEQKDLDTAVANSLKDQPKQEGSEPEPMNLDGKEAVGKMEAEKSFFQKQPDEVSQENAVKSLDSVVENAGAKKEEQKQEEAEERKKEPGTATSEKKKEEEFALSDDEPEQPEKDPCDRLLDRLKQQSSTPLTKQTEKNIRTLYENAENAKKHLQQMSETGERFRGGEDVKQIVAFNSIKNQIEHGGLSAHAAAILGTDQGARFMTYGTGLSDDMKHASSSAHEPEFFQKNFLEADGLNKMTDISDKKMFGFVNAHVEQGKDLQNALNKPSVNVNQPQKAPASHAPAAHPQPGSPYMVQVPFGPLG